MIIKASDMEKSVTEKPRGGPGKAEGVYAFRQEKAPAGSAMQMAAFMTLEPNSGFGYHQHVDNEELYAIITGHGTFVDNDKSEHQVGPGDMTLTLKGESHGLTNTGKEPLKFLAVITKK